MISTVDNSTAGPLMVYHLLCACAFFSSLYLSGVEEKQRIDKVKFCARVLTCRVDERGRRFLYQVKKAVIRGSNQSKTSHWRQKIRCHGVFEISFYNLG